MANPTRLKRAARVILVGAPGVGKGTQTERLIRRYPQMSSISSGDLLRNNVRNRTPLGIMVEENLKAGELVADKTILRLIYNELKTRGWVKSTEPVMPYNLNSTSEPAAMMWSMGDPFVAGAPQASSLVFSDSPTASFILDGFPRNAAQAAQIDKLVPINFVVNIKTPADIVIDRICNRWVHEPSGRAYNTTFNKPKVEGKDDMTGEPLTRRVDDDPDIWRTRLSNFEKASLPLLEHYDKKGVLWEVNGNSSDEISPKLFAEFDSRFNY